MSGWPSIRILFAKACATGDLAAVEAGLAAGAGVGPLNPKGLTPLHLAAFTGGSPAVVRRLLGAGADVHARISGRITRFSAYAGPPRVGKRELSEPDTPLHAALRSIGHPLWREGTAVAEIVGTLLDAGADPNAPGGSGTSPLLRTAYETWGQVPEIMRLLLAAGADRDAVGFGTSPLFAAVSWHNEPAVAVLLAAGADPCRSELAPSGDVPGTTPLHRAARIGRGSTLRLVLEAARDVDVRDSRGATPLHGAAGMDAPGNVRMLLVAGADPHARLAEPLVLRGRSAATAVEIARMLGLEGVVAELEEFG
ncbi:ankyrin repeat domain-containing protein [Phytomonospora endophytica]|uniref:Ankyrin repeat protein n=1 Tax=Phytomonospora endophytica TaxID=714109 RepID=A0A841FVB3_9ACTN|nr:ankyrin repeat domain-containing protein [Phytomonospora endophytica]MBB6036439.1 ankyrin repeat protein [Phytomonospora endophytica]GIG65760.1 hypothetical protein Pen01_20550 [Phytomonospora endophytica]